MRSPRGQSIIDASRSHLPLFLNTKKRVRLSTHTYLFYVEDPNHLDSPAIANPLMIPHPRKWFKKSKKVEEPPNATETPDAAMSELAESLQEEIQGLTVEIRRLKMQREHLFRDIHDIMLYKCQAPILEDADSAISFPLPKSSTPSLHRHRSTQSLWFPISIPPIPENNATPDVEMGLFGPRSRVSSFTSPTAPDKPGSAPVTPAATIRRRPVRAMSQGSVSSTNSKPTSDSPSTPTRTAWRVVEKKLESVYLARAAAVPAPATA